MRFTNHLGLPNGPFNLESNLVALVNISGCSRRYCLKQTSKYHFHPHPSAPPHFKKMVSDLFRLGEKKKKNIPR
jgi:hypothetical protein